MRGKRVLKTAILKVKYVGNPISPELIPFEEFIESSHTSIQVDFLDGRRLMEDNFRSLFSQVDKFYLEFFDSFDSNHMMEYLTSIQSDFRVTSMEGTVVRLSHDDFLSYSNFTPKKESSSKLVSYCFLDEKKRPWQKKRKQIDRKEA